MTYSPLSCRARALQRIAHISSTSNPSTLWDLTKNTSVGSISAKTDKPSDLVRSPISFAELETLFALCKAAPLVEDLSTSTKLVHQLGPYLSEANAQSFSPSPFLRSIEPCPWDLLTNQLTHALLATGIKHHSLKSSVQPYINAYLQKCAQVARVSRRPESRESSATAIEEQLEVATTTASLSGFLAVAAQYADFFAADVLLDGIRLLRDVLKDDFLVAVEGVFSSIRSTPTSKRSLAEWKLYASRYAATGRPLGTMLLQRDFMRFLLSCSALQICTVHQLREQDFYKILSRPRENIQNGHREESVALVQIMAEQAIEAMHFLEDGADYVQLGSAGQQQLAASARAASLQTMLQCMLAGADAIDADSLLSWLEDTMADTALMRDEHLAKVVMNSMVTVGRLAPANSSSLSRSITRFIVQGGANQKIATHSATALSDILKSLSNDALISGLYSLGNVLSTNPTSDRITLNSSQINGTVRGPKVNGVQDHTPEQSTGSDISLDLVEGEEVSVAYGRIILAIVTVACRSRDKKIADLAQSMLLQKLGRLTPSVDLHILREVASLAVAGDESEFQAVLKLYNRLSHEAVLSKNEKLLECIKQARNHISRSLDPNSTLYRIYLVHLLETIISKGDVHERDNTHQADVDLAAREIVELLSPCAILFLKDEPSKPSEDLQISRLKRDAWFNIVVHGITAGSPYGRRCVEDLRHMAARSKALVAEERADQFESEIELNTILRRGMTPQRTTEQKKALINLLPNCEAEVRGLSHPKVVFLIATHLVETMRTAVGDCTQILTYFLDPSLNGSAMETCMSAIAEEILSIYLRKSMPGSATPNTASRMAEQLAAMLAGCCHRILRVQQIAGMFANRIVSQVPSSLCQRTPLFALLELLKLMWMSCLEAELDEYELKANYHSELGNVSIQLSDDYSFRRNTLNNLYKNARSWLTLAINVSPLDVKGLLQTYLAADDEELEGHISLGRSFALEMGSIISNSDRKLVAVEHHGDFEIDAASDFVAQYTARQEYKFADSLPDYDREWTQLHKSSTDMDILDRNGTSRAEDIKTQDLLAQLERRARDGKYVSLLELRDVLRRAAALMGKQTQDQSKVIHHLVSIPFAIFTKQAIKLGISLWLGIMNEFPQLEPMVLALVAEEWERSLQNRVGVFSPKLRHLDPFFLKEEFAPSDKKTLMDQEQAARNLIAPNLRLLQFISSHFQASRLGSPHAQKIFHKIAVTTLRQLEECNGHPLAREFYFQVVLFGLDVYRFCTGVDTNARWRLKDLILSAGLYWFYRRPCWSYGGNRLQIKAEVNLMKEVLNALGAISSHFTESFGPFYSLSLKQELLSHLIQNEQMRLLVWLYPLEHEKRHAVGAHLWKSPPENIWPSLLRCAWGESPSLAVQIVMRFSSTRLTNEVRALLLRYPELAVDEPDALQVLIGASLPTDISFQLKYLLFWAPVNPITAVTYFLPEYDNHPYIVQYAMRALESHSVDVTFFYVPQIVQTLRYDVLGYVQRYILETANFSQLFAHQIIWNMKANAFKDENSTVEDSLKPTLDIVKQRMVDSFCGVDKEFYVREFSFFDEVTDISGKLRPFIKKSKPEKKQKIEEELRKIKVEVGVYLPSNPDGTVIGIDRKSGKPLQSHAKAPFMATFRIKKSMDKTTPSKTIAEAKEDNEVKKAESNDAPLEIWQSAIFKVGDDCRQDLLALQLIAAFRGIFIDVGLDVYVFPYRVTATAPGCGVIDVLPNSISRDMLGREAVNGLYDYFISKYGSETSIRFQEARNNFVKSMAAYSVISYLLQFKDRHNGNIMIDDQGHILHIDFGFCFDIAPGGVRFERAPFKLTSEMVAVMGGKTTSQSYRWFEELCIKAFLASRQHTEKLCHIVVLMLGSGLPCFKPETIAHLRQRFVLEKTEREAAEFMRDLIKKSQGSYSTRGYDQFQLMTNGIPY